MCFVEVTNCVDEYRLFDQLPDNIDDAMQWFVFQCEIIKIKQQCGLTMYINALHALLTEHPKPGRLMNFVMAILLHFR